MRYVVHIEYSTDDEELGNKLANGVQEGYAKAWISSRAHGKVATLDERVTRCEE